jgi:hypothetical protein
MDQRRILLMFTGLVLRWNCHVLMVQIRASGKIAVKIISMFGGRLQPCGFSMHLLDLMVQLLVGLNQLAGEFLALPGQSSVNICKQGLAAINTLL